MPDQLYLGNFPGGLVTGAKAFNIDNNSFPLLWNFYVWRGRLKKKRGTTLLGQLEIQVQSVATATPPAVWQVGTIMTLDGSGDGSANLISVFGLPSTATFVPGSFNLYDGTNTYTDNSLGILTGGPGVSGTINYASGDITITGGSAGQPLVGKASLVSFSYYPSLPVMGLEDYLEPVPENDATGNLRYPFLLAFDTEKAFQFNQTASPQFFYNVSYYKATGNPVVWSGLDYQLFWSTNYSNAFWATNNKPGFHFLTGTYVSGTGTSVIAFDFTSTGPFTTLKVNDVLWFNEWSGGSTINGVSGIVTTVSGTPGRYSVTFTSNQTVAGTGIAQMLTNSLPDQDGIRWYDGDPTSGTGIPTSTDTGWVNFAPPLTANILQPLSIHNLPAGKYYLVGAQMIVPFKGYLLFFGPWVQKVGSSPVNLQDTVIWSWNGTPYYTDPVPVNQSSNPSAYYIDVSGNAGLREAGISQPIVSVQVNEDVLIVSFTRLQSRFIYTGNNLFPFAFFTINSELGASATFSGIALDRGVVTFGTYGIAITDQQSAKRLDLDIPDQVFNIRASDSGPLRVNAIRDFYREWMYFSLPVVSSRWKFPTNTLMYNYRGDTWSVLYENYTKHGNFYSQKSFTWAQLNYFTWSQWNEPWNSAISSKFFPRIIAGNPQGYVLVLDEDTNEAPSGTIKDMAASGTNTLITSTNHCVSDASQVFKEGDFLYFSNVIGLKTSTITSIVSGNPTVIMTTNTFALDSEVKISNVFSQDGSAALINDFPYTIIAVSGSSITIDYDSTDITYLSSGAGGIVTSSFNGEIGLVTDAVDENNFIVDIPFPQFTTSYLGGGQYTRLCRPLFQTKQFAPYWDQGRQVRLGRQQYLLDTTDQGQVSLNIYLSQDQNTVWNDSPVIPNDDITNSSLEYSQVLYTCPESTNLGLTPITENLQTPTAKSQSSIWHRVNTSLQGESIQVGITLSPVQMRIMEYATAEITLQAINLSISQGPLVS